MEALSAFFRMTIASLAISAELETAGEVTPTSAAVGRQAAVDKMSTGRRQMWEGTISLGSITASGSTS